MGKLVVDIHVCKVDRDLDMQTPMGGPCMISYGDFQPCPVGSNPNPKGG